MPQRSPTIEGFRMIFRRPSLTLAEVAWRWSFWAAGAFLLTALLVEYLDTLPVGSRDLLFLNSGQPTLMGKALDHIFQGSSLRLLLGAIVLSAGLAIAWTLVAAVGRSASLGAIREYFSSLREPSPLTSATSDAGSRHPLRALAGLNLLRLAAGLAATVAIVGAFLLPALISTKRSPRPGLAFLFTLAILLLVSMAWMAVNWTLSLSAVFAIRDRTDSLSSIATAARFSRDRATGLWSINFWFGLAHLSLFFVGTSAASVVLGMAQILPVVLVLSGLLFVTLLYFVAADSIHIGRMAAWYCLVETPVISAPIPAAVSPEFSVTSDSMSPAGASPIVGTYFPPEDDIVSEVKARSTTPPPIEPEV